MSKVKIAMVGAAGKMGRRIISLITEDERCELNGALEHSACPFLGHDAGDVAGCGKLSVEITDDIDKAFDGCDVFIDFTGAEPTMANLSRFQKAGVPAVIGSTGMTTEQTKELEKLSSEMPVLFSPNMSVGVNLTFKILEMVTQAIGETWDIEIIEAHHRMKKDAPSGTAMRMGEVIANVLGRDIEKDGAFCRHGLIGERTDREIGMQTLRAGDIVGEHTAMFCTNGERIEITHRAHTRDMFAKGAISAAVWLKGRDNGFYNMFDVLGL
ncbi:dihydrodipicolinate reductase [Denitrovibrio acetiphilus DSM 12809]|uniref:4-hydroxy-tetrahydrodipicolinate reductase n=1 Tax=Denitrovibrio acetiphilus (strain DSM 12809 / NBRC 114555 / N2460) TaxID=522772 RepID=D4H4C3_DENA2|nr:4-hydroxy-tetrahydrodipicolinate reductase [Denitrovibrio acetiphilus]ADD69252.1 dihydrodipicolinate reductase [Denitrovibrio acetiphilus DSM 12809]